MKSKVKSQSQQAVEMAKTSISTLVCQSPTSSFRQMFLLLTHLLHAISAVDRPLLPSLSRDPLCGFVCLILRLSVSVYNSQLRDRQSGKSTNTESQHYT